MSTNAINFANCDLFRHFEIKVVQHFAFNYDTII
jgi:hypothetical protein